MESSEDLPLPVQRRKTSRERGRKLYRPRRRAAATWYATHTVDEAREAREASPAVVEEAKGVEMLSVSPGELEPYTSAAARFKAEMEFLDLSSFPASPEAPGSSV